MAGYGGIVGYRGGGSLLNTAAGVARGRTAHDSRCGHRDANCGPHPHVSADANSPATKAQAEADRQADEASRARSRRRRHEDDSAAI